MPNEHSVSRQLVHHDWDRSRPPVLTVESGDLVRFDLPITGEGQVDETSTVDEVSWDFDTIYNLAGPVAVAGARPGETLQVDVLELQPGAWGWTAIIPELGLLPDDFPEPYLRIFDLRGGVSATLVDGVEIPIEPFLGTMGVHTDVDEVQLPFPPHKGGGNIDNRHLVVGSTLYLPIWCDGALFSCGDAHAAQGDGEVCVSAIECAMEATLRLTLHRRSISAPRFTGPTVTPAGDPLPHQSTMGIADDLYVAAQLAVRAMIDWIVEEHTLSRKDAYLLCSLAGDLRIHEIVDAGVWNVGMMLPRRVFVQS
jgi:acetamidase/formamidase